MVSILTIAILPFALLQTSCENKRAPSVLVIAVDSLPFNLSLCSRDGEEGRSGFATLCDESIRFTHAMTPSTLSVPALASMMTGLYPYEHGIRHNGSAGLSPRFTTFAEAAVRKGYRTAFFSGGPPVWRRTGLHQGFELFDDLVNFSSGRLFRPLHESIHVFEEWLVTDVADSSFVATLYAPDLSFTDTVTETLSGEMRSLSYDSQLEELEETLDDLFTFLKKRNRWDDTMVMLVGLNGRELSLREGEVEPINLHSENTQVSLFIKPAQKPRDEAIAWTVDRNVSLTDLGRTLLEMMDHPSKSDKPEEFPVQSVLAGLKGAPLNWPENRPVLLESGWGSWQNLSGVRAGVLRDQELVIFDSPPVAYNTLTDRFETMPLPQEKMDSGLLSALRRKNYRAWSPLSSSLQKTFGISSLNWLSPAKAASLHKDLSSLAREPFPHPRILRWAAQSALEQKDWALLKALGKRTNKADWIAVADRNMGKPSDPRDLCLRLFLRKNPSNEEIKQCPDELLISLLDWTQAKRKNEKNKEVARRRFMRAWEGAQIDLRILKANAALGLLWLPMTAEEGIPSRTSLALALPESK
ncbi:MAG TPA: sulfatase-like hydrolase/transferase [Pseudobdellovibrionaceae bacterium]|nr:sulfatase-like hydrolase/transferase [Pseudobdellovibrionaceae bacterium]